MLSTAIRRTGSRKYDRASSGISPKEPPSASWPQHEQRGRERPGEATVREEDIDALADSRLLSGADRLCRCPWTSPSTNTSSSLVAHRLVALSRPVSC